MEDEISGEAHERIRVPIKPEKKAIKNRLESV
jgi:hypothetical protein